MRVMIACLLAAITLTAQAPKPQDPPSDCAADGSVVNGLTGQPLRRANVSTGYSSPSGTSTDADGKWTISGIACGGIIFTAEKDGFIQNSYGRPAAKAQVNTALKPVTLTSGNVVHGLKIELMPESVATGRVLDDAGDPVSGAQVRAMRSVLREGKRMMLPSGYASSDSSGTYRMSGLAAGRYFLCATSSRVRYPIGGGNAVIYGENCFPGPVPANAQGGMQIASGQEEHADFTLTEATGVHIRGAAAGGLAAPVTIQLFKVDPNGFGGGSTLRPQQTRNGKFEFTNVTPGTYTVQGNVALNGDIESAGAYVEVGNLDIEGVNLVFQRGSQVSGVVRIEDVAPPSPPPPQNQGQSSDPPPPAANGKPTVNVNLSAVGFFRAMGRVQWNEDHTAFAYSDVESGRYRLGVNVFGGAVGYFVKSVTLHDSDVRTQDLTVFGPTGPIEITVSNAAGTLQGAVADSDGNPVASQIILRCGEFPVMIGNSQEDGKATIRNVPAGSCKAWAFDRDNEVEYADEDWMSHNAGIGMDVTIATGSGGQVTLVRRSLQQ